MFPDKLIGTKGQIMYQNSGRQRFYGSDVFRLRRCYDDTAMIAFLATNVFTTRMQKIVPWVTIFLLKVFQKNYFGYCL